MVVSNCSCTREDYEWLVLQPCPGPRALLVPQQWGQQAGASAFPWRKGAAHGKQVFIKQLLGARSCAGHFLCWFFHLVVSAVRCDGDVTPPRPPPAPTKQAAVIYVGIDCSGIYFHKVKPRKEHAKGSIVNNSFSLGALFSRKFVFYLKQGCVCVYVCVYIYIYSIYICICRYIHIHMYMYISTYTYTHTHTHTHTYIYICRLPRWC